MVYYTDIGDYCPALRIKTGDAKSFNSPTRYNIHQRKHLIIQTQIHLRNTYIVALVV